MFSNACVFCPGALGGSRFEMLQARIRFGWFSVATCHGSGSWEVPVFLDTRMWKAVDIFLDSESWGSQKREKNLVDFWTMQITHSLTWHRGLGRHKDLCFSTLAFWVQECPPGPSMHRKEC